MLFFKKQNFQRNQNNINNINNKNKNPINKNLTSLNSKLITTKDTYQTTSKNNTLDKKNSHNNTKNENIKQDSNNNINNINSQIKPNENIENGRINNITYNNNIEITTNPNITPDKLIITSPTDRIFIGKYIGGQKNGQGKLLLPNDTEYEGNFKNNEFDGYGVFKSKSYNYFGNYTEGKKKGKGKYEDLVKGSTYNGEFSDDQKNGYGEENYNDGSVYKGEYKNGLRDGKGILILKGKNKEISIYKGEFKNDQINGKGRFKWPNKKEYYGEWENNEISGYGILVDEQIRHIGYFSHYKKEGYGASFYEGESYVLIGKWKDDLLEGPAIYLQLDKNNSNNNNEIINEKIVGMFKGEMISMNLCEEDINTFKNSEDYHEMTELYKNKFYPDFIKCINYNESKNIENK